MRAIAGRLPIALRRRLRALRQRPGAMAHLHRGHMIGVRARHESGRHQHAARQCGQEQQRDPEMGPAALCPTDIHQDSLSQSERAPRPAIVRSPPRACRSEREARVFALRGPYGPWRNFPGRRGLRECRGARQGGPQHGQGAVRRPLR